MHLFISAGEPSGDLHGSNLIRAIRRREPSAQFVGFGGDRMAAAGADLHYPLAHLAVMGIRRVLANLRTFYRLGDRATDYFRNHRPDAVVLIDYPGFHLPLADRARAAGIPVYYFVPPQIWAWKSWRVKRVRRAFDAVLTALPFEDEWYRSRGVNTQYVGHPYYDDLAAQRLDLAFLTGQRAKPGPVVGLLPGSRDQEVTANSPLMIAAARKIHAARPDVRFLVAGFNETQAAVVGELARDTGLPVEVHVGRTPEIIELSGACVAVSGSVGLEMMYRLKPAVIVYRMGRLTEFLVRKLVHVPYMSLVNLLAGDEVYPEFATSQDDSGPIADRVLGWLNDPRAWATTVGRLQAIKQAAAVPGACDRAAGFLLNAVRPRPAVTAA